MERSHSSSETTAVVYDLGGVLVPSGGALAALSAALDVPQDELAEPYWAYRDSYDEGDAPAAYWQRVGAALGRRLDGEWVDRLDRIDVAGWSRIADDVTAMLSSLAASGIPLGVLSNAPVSLADAVRRSAWSTVFQGLVFSSDVGLLKPDPWVYRAADERLGFSPANVVFFDDRPGNVAAARAHGWRAHVWTGCEGAREVLAQEGLRDGPRDGLRDALGRPGGPLDG
ncbi:HAD family hydrolase [Streptomyces sp. NPDC127033]|uniref:HAD family hydrolase n=1 Tax=Streptomyces sp. NPDC127033 TaxID=3347110 RepID=UPI0036482435